MELFSAAVRIRIPLAAGSENLTLPGVEVRVIAA
jgi:hypothetical protein